MPTLEPSLPSDLRGWIDAAVQHQVEARLQTAFERIADDINTQVEQLSDTVYTSQLDRDTPIRNDEVRQRAPSALELELKSFGSALVSAFEQALTGSQPRSGAVQGSREALELIPRTREVIAPIPDDELPATLGEVRARSLSTLEAASTLGVNPSRIRQRLLARTLYGFKEGTGWWLPEFQFDGGHTVPAIERVFPELRPSVSPVAVFRWFLTPWADLVVDEDHEVVVSPRRWLLTGGDPGPMIAQARIL